MRILVYGAGVLGCNLAANLLQSGHDVTLLARGVWAAQIREHGLTLKRTLGRNVDGLAIPVVEDLAADDAYDVVFVVMRYTQLDGVVSALAQNNSQTVVFVGNNIKPEHYAAQLPGKNVLFAFAMSAGHRETDCVKCIDLKKVVIGGLGGKSFDEALISRIFDGTGYKVTVEPHMDGYLLCHAAYVVPIAFGCYFADGNLRNLRGNRDYMNRIIDAEIEGYAAVEAAGYPIRPESDAKYKTSGWRRLMYIFFKLMCATVLGKLCASDHAMNAIDEMSALNRDFKELFEQTGVAHPAWTETEASAEKYLE